MFVGRGSAACVLTVAYELPVPVAIDGPSPVNQLHPSFASFEIKLSALSKPGFAGPKLNKLLRATRYQETIIWPLPSTY